MKLILPWVAARKMSLGPRGICRSALVAPSKGGTSGQRVLTVPPFSPPESDSTIRQDMTAPNIRNKARIVADFEMVVAGIVFISVLRGATVIDISASLQSFERSFADWAHLIDGAIR